MATTTATQSRGSANPQTVIAQSQSANKAASNVTQFPADLPIHYAKLTFVKYDRKNPASQPTTSITGSIILPVPSQLVDGSNLRYSGNEFHPSVGNIPGLYDGKIDPVELAGEAQKLIEEKGWAAVPEIAVKALQAAPGSNDSDAMKMVGIFQGRIANPHLTTIFQGVELRTHAFSWRLSPRNVAETKAITAIDKMIRSKIHPEISKTGFSLNYPDQVYVTFYPESADFNYKVRKSVITEYRLNNAATGMPAWFASTKAPTDFELTMSLMEVDILTRNELDGTATS